MAINVIVDTMWTAAIAGADTQAATATLTGDLVVRPGITFVRTDNVLSGLIDNRMLVSVTESGPDVAMPIVELFDFEALGAFDAGS